MIKKLFLTLTLLVTGCASAKEELVYWPCRAQSSIEINESWGLRKVTVHHLCFNNELDDIVDVSSQSMLSVVDSDKRFSNKPVFFDVSKGKGAKLKLYAVGGNKYLSWSYSSGTNSNSLKLYKLNNYIVLEPIGELFSDDGSVVIDEIGGFLQFKTKELDVDGNMKPKLYQLQGDVLLSQKQ